MAYKAFVSSTFEDLKEHRQAVIASLLKAGLTVDPMEEWTASTGEPKTFSQDRIKDCHLFILLVAYRRGHVPRGEERSITQLEYEAARSSGIDVLVFMLKEKALWLREFDDREKDPGIGEFRSGARRTERRGVLRSRAGLDRNRARDHAVGQREVIGVSRRGRPPVAPAGR